MVMVSIAGTLWLLISLAFILDSVDAPRGLIRTTLALLALSLLAVLLPSVRDQCSGGPCFGVQGLPGKWYDVLTYGLPTVAIGFTIAAIAYGLLRHRRAKA
jgi:hypothetical protein